MSARVVGWDEETDVAVLEVDDELPVALGWADTEALAEGQRIVSLGYPAPATDFSATTGGIVSFQTR
ncbi:MAG: trypsin-like peptidase domain-containing protein [Acidimicrobiia bacterium]|nr:trypsin-like peptidase domain-containing protein [Acidimicrobiia bacterium]